MAVLDLISFIKPSHRQMEFAKIATSPDTIVQGQDFLNTLFIHFVNVSVWMNSNLKLLLLKMREGNIRKRMRRKKTFCARKTTGMADIMSLRLPLKHMFQHFGQFAGSEFGVSVLVIWLLCFQQPNTQLITNWLIRNKNKTQMT